MVGSSVWNIIPPAFLIISAPHPPTSAGPSLKSAPKTQGAPLAFANSIALVSNCTFLGLGPSLVWKYADCISTPLGTTFCTQTETSRPSEPFGEPSTGIFSCAPHGTCVGVIIATPADGPPPSPVMAATAVVFHPTALVAACMSTTASSLLWCSWHSTAATDPLCVAAYFTAAII